MSTSPAEKRQQYNALLQECKRGSTDARETLFGLLRVRLSLVLKYSLWGWPADDLNDIVQETLLVVAEKLDQLDSNPDTFALDVMRKKVGNRLSRRRRRTEVSIEPTDSDDHQAYASISQDDTVETLENAELSAAIQRAIRQLTPLCQMLFIALLENLSVAETWKSMRAAQGDLQRSAFDKRLFDCRRKLRRLLANRL